jgi:hypothetical protein
VRENIDALKQTPRFHTQKSEYVIQELPCELRKFKNKFFSYPIEKLQKKESHKSKIELKACSSEPNFNSSLCPKEKTIKEIKLEKFILQAKKILDENNDSSAH